jgi:hypothetical protein
MTQRLDDGPSRDQLQNEVLTIAHHIDDIEKSIEKKEPEYALEGLRDAREAIQRLAGLLDTQKELARMAEDHPIYQKITEGTVTADDFNKLIQEATPESVRDRVRRRTSRNETDEHQDGETGHQPLTLPNFSDRVQPKRKPENSSQMHGRGKLGHRHSARTQSKANSKVPKRFDEAMSFIQAHIGESCEKYSKDLQLIDDKYALATLVTKMLSVRNIDRDWLYELRSKIK